MSTNNNNTLTFPHYYLHVYLPQVGEAEALEVGREVGMKRGHLVRLARWVKDPKARHAAEKRVCECTGYNNKRTFCGIGALRACMQIHKSYACVFFFEAQFCKNSECGAIQRDAKEKTRLPYILTEMTFFVPLCLLPPSTINAQVAQASAEAALDLAKQEFALLVDQARRDLGAFCANTNANSALYGGDSSGGSGGGGGDAAKLVAVVAKRVGAAEAQQTSDHATMVEELSKVHKAVRKKGPFMIMYSSREVHKGDYVIAAQRLSPVPYLHVLCSLNSQISRLEMAQTRDRKDWLSSLQGVATRVEQLASQQQHDAHDLAAKVCVRLP